MRTPVSVGVVGLGDWGQQLAQRFHELPQAELRWLCDLNPQLRLRARSLYPRGETAADLDELLADEALDAVAIATPVGTRAALVRRALDAEKHVFAHEPFAVDAEAAAAIVDLAAQRKRRLVPTHALAFHPGLRKLKELIELGRLGEIYYVYADVELLDLRRHDESALCSLGAPELSLILYLLSDEPVEVGAWSDTYGCAGSDDVASCLLRFATGVTAHLHLSWLNPHPRHRITVVGSKRTAIFDEYDAERPLSIYDQAAARTSGTWLDGPPRVGDIVSPRIQAQDPVRAACEYFVSAVRAAADEGAAARRGASVVATLEALQRSASAGGARTPLVRDSALPNGVVPLRARAAHP